MTTYILRLIWIGSQLLALCAGEGSRYRWWCWYLMASLLLSVTYWPELLGAAWYEAFWPLLLAVVVLRTVAALEALHYQTEGFPLWSRMMAGVFLMAIAVVLSVWELRAGTSAETAVQLRRYLQLWTGAAMVLTWGMLWSVGLLRWRVQDQHSAIVGGLCLLHMGVTVVSLHYPHPGVYGTVSEKIQYDNFWMVADRWATGLDSLIYLGWSGHRVRAWHAEASRRTLPPVPAAAQPSLESQPDRVLTSSHFALCKEDNRQPPQIADRPSTS